MCFKRTFIIVLAATVVAFLAQGCNKEPKRTPIKDVTGYVWMVGALKDAANPYISPLPYYEVQLNDEGKFSINLSGTTCSGTYTWTEVDSVSANVSFFFKKWNDPPEYPGSAQKLKNVLTGTNRCYILKGINVPPILQGYTKPTIALDFEGTAGWVYLYR